MTPENTEALRYADEAAQAVQNLRRTSVPIINVAPLLQKQADHIRRLVAENEALRATLASSCDEEREQLWEATPGGGCSRALDAERQLEALRARDWGDAIAAGEGVLLQEQAALLRECRMALDELLKKKPAMSGLVCGSTTLGNLRASLTRPGLKAFLE